MIYVFLADGFEEIEALAPVDVLRRAGIETITVGVTGKTITGGHDISVTADKELSEITTDGLEGIILPGGLGGTNNLEKSEKVNEYIDYCVNKGLWLCAICAAPSILAHKGLLKGKNATSFPSFWECLNESGTNTTKDFVVTDGKLITARGMGVSVDFGLEIIAAIKGRKTADGIREQIQCRK